MANTSLSEQIRSRVAAFVDELNELIRQSTMETVQQVLGGRAPSGRGRRRVAAGGRGRGKAAPRGRAKGAKRSPVELQRLTSRLQTYIKSNPGRRIEQIGEGMGVPTRDLSLPAKKLLAKKAIKTRGQKRATQYYPR